MNLYLSTMHRFNAPHSGTLRWHRLVLALTALMLLLPMAAAQEPAAPPTGAISVPGARQASTLAIIPIKGPIDMWTSLSITRRIAVAQAAGADGIVIELNTPGGELGATFEITDAIKRSPIPNTIAWVHPNAISAGAIIALACREIVVSDNAIFGDAAPVLIRGGGIQQVPDTERAKMLSIPLADLIDSARRNGYDEKLVQGFVTLGVELWFVENIDTGEQLFISEDEYRLLFDGEPDRSQPQMGTLQRKDAAAQSSRLVQAPSPSEPTALHPASPEITDETIKDLNSTLKVRGTHSNRPLISAADKGSYRLLEYVTDGSTLLTLKTDQVIRYNLSSAIVNSDAELQRFAGASVVIRLNESWSERLARFFSYQMVQYFLIVVFLLGMFIEMSAPGLGLPGGIALIALGGLLAPQFIAGAAAWWGIVAMLGGLGLIAVEIFVIPGFGLFGIGGLAALFAGLLGVVLGPAGLSPHTEADWMFAVATVLLALASSGIGMYFVVKNHNSFPGLRNLVLSNRTDEFGDPGSGMLASMGEPDADVRKGDVGIAITPLRPGGTAEFNGALADVVCDRGFIEQGTRVRVIEAGGMRVAVEPLEDDPKGLFEDAPDPADIETGTIEDLEA